MRGTQRFTYKYHIVLSRSRYQYVYSCNDLICFGTNANPTGNVSWVFVILLYVVDQVYLAMYLDRGRCSTTSNLWDQLFKMPRRE